VFKINKEKIMKNFNWKKFAVRVLVSWAIFAFVLGFISGFKSYAQRSNSWLYIGAAHGTIADIEMDLQFYAMKNSLMISSEGNPVLVIKIVYGELGETISEIEFDCDKGLMRSIKSGKTFESMVKRQSPQWLKPPATSAGELLLKQSCSRFLEKVY
jgi:hypothetical protein